MRTSFYIYVIVGLTCSPGSLANTELPASRAGNGKNLQFPPIAVERSWLKQGKNVLKFVHHRTAGLHVNKVKIVLEKPRDAWVPEVRYEPGRVDASRSVSFSGTVNEV